MEGGLTSSGKSSQNSGVFRLKACEARASLRRSASEVSTEPTVGVDSSINESTPFRIEATDHAGTHVSGWKSLIERQRRVLVLNRPLRGTRKPRRKKAGGETGVEDATRCGAPLF